MSDQKWHVYFECCGRNDAHSVECRFVDLHAHLSTAQERIRELENVVAGFDQYREAFLATEYAWNSPTVARLFDDARRALRSKRGTE